MQKCTPVRRLSVFAQCTYTFTPLHRRCIRWVKRYGVYCTSFYTPIVLLSNLWLERRCTCSLHTMQYTPGVKKMQPLPLHLKWVIASLMHRHRVNKVVWGYRGMKWWGGALSSFFYTPWVAIHLVLLAPRVYRKSTKVYCNLQVEKKKRCEGYWIKEPENALI